MALSCVGRRLVPPCVGYAPGVRGRLLATSAPCLPSMSCWGTSRRTTAPLLPQGEDPRERHQCAPSKYIGRTPTEIVARFKDQTTFPWYRLSVPLRKRRFEEIWQLAKLTKNKAAVQAVDLLMDGAFDAKAER